MFSYLGKSWFVFTSAMVFALVVPEFGAYIKPYLDIVLIAMMTISLIDIPLTRSASNLKKGVILFLINYFLLGAVIIILSLLISPDYFNGFVVMAAVPCAIAVLPFSKLLNADKQASSTGLIISYLFSLILTPTIIWIFYNQVISIFALLRTVILLVVLPLVIAYFLQKKKFSIKNDKTIINILFFVGIYGFLSLNRNDIVSNFFSLWPVFVVLFLRTFVLSTVVFILSKKYEKYAISLTIFSGYKNLGYAALLSLTLFGTAASLPATLGIVFEVLNFIWLQKLTKL